MRYSTQRETIYQIVKDAQCHPSADWVFDRAKVIIPNISLATVYRNLGLLKSRGNIRSFTIKGIVRYDGNIKAHSHFMCRECDLMIDMLPGNLKSVIQKGLPKYFKAESVDLKISGLCKTCQNKQDTIEVITC